MITLSMLITLQRKLEMVEEKEVQSSLLRLLTFFLLLVLNLFFPPVL